MIISVIGAFLAGCGAGTQDSTTTTASTPTIYTFTIDGRTYQYQDCTFYESGIAQCTDDKGKQVNIGGSYRSVEN